MAAYGFGELDPIGAGAAGAAVDEDVVVGLGVRDDALVGGQCGGADGGGVVGVDAGGEGGGAGAGGDDVLRQGAEAGGRVEAAEDGFAGRERCCGAAGGDDTAAEVDARGGGTGDEAAAEEGEFGDFVVDGVEGHADDFDEDLFGAEGGGWGGGGGGVEGEVFLETAFGGGELPGFHC